MDPKYVRVVTVGLNNCMDAEYDKISRKYDWVVSFLYQCFQVHMLVLCIFSLFHIILNSLAEI